MAAHSLHIGVVCDRFPSLSETFVQDQVLGYLDAGHRVTVFAGEPETSAAKGGRADAICLDPGYSSVLWTRYPPLRRRRLGRVVVDLCAAPLTSASAVAPRKNGPQWLTMQQVGVARALARASLTSPLDVVHCHFASNWYLARHVLRRFGHPPTVLTLHGVDVRSAVRRWGTRPLLEACEESSIMTANSSFTATEARSFGCDVDIHVVPMGVDLNDFDFRSPIRHVPPRLLSVGRIVEKKGIEYAIRAIGILKNEGFAVEYTVVGDGPLAEKCRALTKSLLIDDRVHFAGWVQHSDIHGYLAQADILVAPSVVASNGDSEGQGVMIVEAQAVGLPVVATLHNGFPESVAQSSHNWLVPERDPAALASAIRGLATADWVEIAASGRKHVEDGFDLAHTNSRMLELLEFASGCHEEW